MIGIAIGLLLFAFLAVERRSANPVIEPRLFVSPGFAAAGVAAMAVLFAVIGTVFVLSMYFAHRGASDVGIALRLGRCLPATRWPASSPHGCRPG